MGYRNAGRSNWRGADFFDKSEENRSVSRSCRRLYATGGLGASGGRSRAVTADWNPTFLWLPSQNGLFSECPHRHRLIAVRPANPNTPPCISQIVNSPSSRKGPLSFTITFVSANGDSC